MAKDVIHISEAEAASKFASLMARVVQARKSLSRMMPDLLRSCIPPSRYAAPSPNALLSYPRTRRLQSILTSQRMLKKQSKAIANR
jgi:hypothetical protein